MLASPPRSLVKACRRLNPAIDVDVDIVAVARAAGASTKAEWQAGTLSNVTVDAGGAVRVAESGSRELFKSQGTSAEATVRYNWFSSSNNNQNEILWLDFWPDPAIVGPGGAVLHSFDVVLGRKDGGSMFGRVGTLSDAGVYRFTVARFDDKWNRELLGSYIDIPCGQVLANGGVVSINFRNRGRTIAIRTGRLRSSTGSGLDSTGHERTVDVQLHGDRKVSHLDVPMGFSIGIQVIGLVPRGAWLGMLPLSTYPAFDPSTFWRTTAGARDCGPYAPDAGGYSALDTNHNPGYGLLETGAVPGYGARNTAATTSGTPNGQWGISRQVGRAQTPQTAEERWNQPWHVLRAVSYAAGGSVVKVFDLGAVPTNEVHFRADASEPVGTSVTYSLRGRNSTGDSWTAIGAVSDGAVLPVGQRFRYYEVTATLTASTDALTSPVLQAIFITERVRYATYRYAQEVDSTASIDPVTGQSEIGELKLPLLRAGRGDARDLVTDIATRFSPSNVEAWVYARETRTGARHFLNLYRLEQREPSPEKEEFVFVSGMDRLKVVIPQKQITYEYPSDGSVGTINSVSYNATTKACTIGVSGTPFAGVNLTDYRYQGLSGVLAGSSWFIVGSPAPTASSFTIVLEDDTQQPSPGDKFKLSSDQTVREEVAYSGQDFAAIYTDVLAAQAAVPQRYRGVLPPTTGRLGTGRLSSDGRPALEVLQELALHCGGALAWRKGRIDWVNIYGEHDVVATWSERDYTELQASPGQSRRMPSIGLKYGYDYLAQKFGHEITLDDEDALLALGRANLFDVFTLPDELCKWNDYDEAIWLGTTFLKAWSTGVRLWKVKLAHPWPWVDFGHAVAISTDSYTDRRPSFAGDGVTDEGTPIKGRVSAVGVVVARNLLGTEFTVAVLGLDAITSVTGTDGTREIPTTPLADCPAIAASYHSEGILGTGIQLPAIEITFTRPADPSFDHLEVEINSVGKPVSALLSGSDSPLGFYGTWGVTYTLTPYAVNTSGKRKVGTPINIAIPNQWGIPRRIPLLDDSGNPDGFAAHATDQGGNTLHPDVEDILGRPVSSMFNKDTDDLDDVDDSSSTYKRTTAEEKARAAAALVDGVAVGGAWPFPITPNKNGAGVDNPGEVCFGVTGSTGGTFTHPNGTAFSVSAQAEAASSWEGGGTVGNAYVMFVGSDKSRFTIPGLPEPKYREFLVVQYRAGTWYYDNNSNMNSPFTPNENDCIVARIERASTASTGIDQLVRYAPVTLTDANEKTGAGRGYLGLDPGGNLAEGKGQYDGIQVRVLSKGHIKGLCRNGQTVTFPVSFQSIPLIRIEGGIVFEPRAKWGPNGDGTETGAYQSTQPTYEDVAALNVTTQQFTVRARLRQKGTPVARQDNFPSGTLNVAGQDSRVITTNAPAADDSYTTHYSVQLTKQGLTPGTATLIVAVDVSLDAALNWVERASKRYDVTGDGPATQTWGDEEITIVASGLSSTSRIRLRIKSLFGTAPACSVDPGSVTYSTSSTDKFASKTPDNDLILTYEALDVTT